MAPIAMSASTAFDWSGRLALVTGGAGFIGSHLCEALVAAGARVRVLDDLSTGKRAQLPAGAELVVGDVRDLEACRAACRDAERVFHLAAICSVPRSNDDPATTVAVNVSGTANVLAAARDAGARVVYASSSAVYGDAKTHPQREGQEGEPLSIYGVSKRLDEQLAAGFARSFGMTAVGLRFFNVYGPRQDPNGPYAAVVARFAELCRRGEPPLIYGDGAQTRDFVHVSDVARACILAGLGAVSGAPVMNIGSGIGISVDGLARAVARAFGRPDLEPRFEPARPGDIVHSVADVARAKKLLDFHTEIGLDQGLACMV